MKQTYSSAMTGGSDLTGWTREKRTNGKNKDADEDERYGMTQTSQGKRFGQSAQSRRRQTHVDALDRPSSTKDTGSTHSYPIRPTTEPKATQRRRLEYTENERTHRAIPPRAIRSRHAIILQNELLQFRTDARPAGERKCRLSSPLSLSLSLCCRRRDGECQRAL